MAQYLCTLLQSHLPDTYTISNSFSFVQELNSVDISGKSMTMQEREAQGSDARCVYRKEGTKFKLGITC